MLTTSAWTPAQVAAIAAQSLPGIPLVGASDIHDALPGFQLWDSWPFETPEGQSVDLDGWTPWVVMCAPRDVHPDLRHDIARLRLMLERGGTWRDCGHLLPDGLNPGSREWAGSTVYDPGTGHVTLFYTATGRRGDTGRSFEQRLFQTSGQLNRSGDLPCVTDWSEPVESVAADGHRYVIVNQTVGEPGFIKGFRDPFHFRDPADGADYLLFTASDAMAQSAFNGVVGLARATAPGFSGWELLPPLVSANGVNNEMERPVLRVHDGCYYLFWSTQRRTFDPAGPTGPNGLYGMVADRLSGPWRPLNGTGLVAPNPAEEPFQTYSWWVMDSLEVAGFVDHWGLKGRSLADQPELVVSQFGGVPAPRFRIALSGKTAQIVGR
jgi:levansucrase